MKPFNRISRREALSGIAAVGTVGIAGCSGDDAGSDAPDPDANPRDLLPDAPEGWETDDEPQQQSAGMIGADAGFGQAFNSPNDSRYPVEIFRFSSESDAQDAEAYWTAYVVRGNFTFAVRGPDVDKAYLLLGNSPALTENYVRNNNIL